jgi:hypothetical protein
MWNVVAQSQVEFHASGLRPDVQEFTPDFVCGGGGWKAQMSDGPVPGAWHIYSGGDEISCTWKKKRWELDHPSGSLGLYSLCMRKKENLNSHGTSRID